MPDDKFNNRYIDQAMVKGNWYGISSGPKPQVFTGNIDKASTLESIRNKALYIESPTKDNGTFPKTKHACTVLTTRYGGDIYLQKLFDLSENVEWDRAKIGSNKWSSWQRVTSFGDASSTADTALQRTGENAAAIDDLYKKIGGKNTKPTIASRVATNEDAISKQGTYIETNSQVITRLTKGYAYDSIARRFVTNNDVREGQLPGIKFYANQNAFSIGGANSVKVLDTGNMLNWGFNGNNSVFIVSNANSDLNGAHVEGGTFVPDDGSGNRGGWYAVFEGSTNTDIILNWVLIVFNQAMQ